MLGQSPAPGPQYNLNQSAEYHLRKVLLGQYDKMVRPVLKPSDVINVTFIVDFKALSSVVIAEYNWYIFQA